MRLRLLFLYLVLFGLLGHPSLLIAQNSEGQLRLDPIRPAMPSAAATEAASMACMTDGLSVEGALTIGGWSAGARAENSALYVSDRDMKDGHSYPPVYQNDLRIPNVIVMGDTVNSDIPGVLLSSRFLCDSKMPTRGLEYHGNFCFEEALADARYLYVNVRGVNVPVYQFNGTPEQALSMGLHRLTEEPDSSMVDLNPCDCDAFITAFNSDTADGISNDEDPEMTHPGTGQVLIPEGTTDTDNGANPEKANGFGIETQTNGVDGMNGWFLQLGGNRVISGVNDKIGRTRLQAMYVMGHDLIADDALYPPVYWNDWSWANMVVDCVPQILQPESNPDLIQISFQLRGPVCQLEPGQFTGTGPRFDNQPVTHDEFHGTSCQDGIALFEEHPTRPIQVTDSAEADPQYKYFYLQDSFMKAYWPMYQFDGDNEWQTLGNYNTWHAIHPDGTPWRGGLMGHPKSGYRIRERGNTFAHDILQVRRLGALPGMLNPDFDPLADPKDRKDDLDPRSN